MIGTVVSPSDMKVGTRAKRMDLDKPHQTGSEVKNKNVRPTTSDIASAIRHKDVAQVSSMTEGVVRIDTNRERIHFVRAGASRSVSSGIYCKD